ncbi:asparaginase [Thalassococcus sp. S3]|uniref:asparaginase n=1 Tax=Thalassococcus sp. S3 TaxID=2017482 RepID=UPI001024306F|nr:asparaginase [Thalassococcus sp. S3]QBF29782.1 L-asparaginase [Thalassococcus sp. S3]
MTQAAPLVEIWRAEFVESVHFGHVVICDASGQVVDVWGDPDAFIYPRSSAKMIQALPLVESGAADRAGLTSEHLALACASHQGAPMHVDRVTAWLADLGLADADLKCGPQMPRDPRDSHSLICSDTAPCRYHNNCSGKHTGFLTLARHLNANLNYVDIEHPVQSACLEAFERVTGLTSPGYGIDGCSAPNFQTTVYGLARAMAHFAAAPEGSAEEKLRTAMIRHPELVAGEGRACTGLMRAVAGKAALKTGAEGVFVGILPEQKLGIALKIADGATRASECVITAILARLGVLDPRHPEALKRRNAPILNWAGEQTGWIKSVI